MKRVVIALGGNAILQPKQEATFENQKKNVDESCNLIAQIVKAGYETIVTHGNGPQVGNILRQNEEAKQVVPPSPVDACSAESQGLIGYMMEQSMKNAFKREGLTQQVATLLTQTEVDKKDEAFEHPTKPIGVFFTKEEAEKLAEEKGWVMKEDAGRGYRRVVPSPQPKLIHGVGAIKKLLADDVIVIASGGGGIPVIREENGELTGVDAVIDKDRSALRLAEQVEADVLMILTDVNNVYLNYGKENQQKLENVQLGEAVQYLEEGHFSDGSMGPKMEAAIEFAKAGKEAIICSLYEAVDALAGKSGTHILPQHEEVLSK
ncbi:carbamate kinase [Bacillus sp. 1P06AnD]|uniref:carbamate kinase n=1 Tax=Bacillus sp. 1P06AnD TaxID=3132208 RepID=UPI0039A2BB19